MRNKFYSLKLLQSGYTKMLFTLEYNVKNTHMHALDYGM